MYLNKGEYVRINGDITDSYRFHAGDTVLDDDCVTAEQDCSWFLATGASIQPVATCQLGEFKRRPNATEKCHFMGEVTYQVRPGKRKRSQMSFYVTEDAPPLVPPIPPPSSTTYNFPPPPPPFVGNNTQYYF